MKNTNFRSNNLQVSVKIEDKYILPQLLKQSNVLNKKMLELCKNSKKHGYRTELNYETIKACEQIILNIERHQPSKVRDALF